MVHGLWSIVLDELFWATCGKWQRRLAAERTEPRRLCHYNEQSRDGSATIAFPKTLSGTLSRYVASSCFSALFFQFYSRPSGSTQHNVRCEVWLSQPDDVILRISSRLQ